MSSLMQMSIPLLIFILMPALGFIPKFSSCLTSYLILVLGMTTLLINLIMIPSAILDNYSSLQDMMKL